MNEYARDLGRVEGVQGAMQRDIEDLKNDVAQIREDLQHVVSVLDSAKGGWKALVAAGAVASALTAGAVKFFDLFGGK